MAETTPTNDARQAQQEASAQRAQQAAREAAHWIRTEVGQLVVNYKARSRYFKWRSYIVVAYLAIAATSVVMAMPQLNTIDAYVVPTTDFKRRLIVSVENQSGQPWTGLRLVLDDAWVFERAQLPAGEKVMPNITQFVKLKSKERIAAPETLQPKLLRVETDQGEYEVTLFSK